MEQGQSKRVFYGIGKAIEAVPKWHAEKFMKLYDKLYLEKRTGLEREVAESFRPVMEKRAKALGWVATGLEVTAITVGAAKGFKFLKDRLQKLPAVDKESSHVVPLDTITEVPVVVNQGDLKQSISHAFLEVRDGSLMIHELGGSVIDAEPVDDLLMGNGESLPVFLKNLILHAPVAIGERIDGSRTTHAIKVFVTGDQSMVGVRREEHQDKATEYFVDLLHGRKKVTHLLHILRDTDGKHVGYALRGITTPTQREWMKAGRRFPTEGLRIRSIEQMALRKEKISQELLDDILAIVHDGKNFREPAINRLQEVIQSVKL